MAAKSDIDFRELKELLDSRLGQLDSKIDDLKINQVRIEEKVNALDKTLERVELDLNKRLDAGNTQLHKRLDDVNAQLNKRLDDTNSQIAQLQGRVTSQTNWFIGIFTVLVTGLLGILGKIAFFPNP
jgi:tetrahydromethanopterin S-methyltransferase subunit G